MSYTAEIPSRGVHEKWVSEDLEGDGSLVLETFIFFYPKVSPAALSPDRMAKSEETKGVQYVARMKKEKNLQRALDEKSERDFMGTSKSKVNIEINLELN